MKWCVSSSSQGSCKCVQHPDHVTFCPLLSDNCGNFMLNAPLRLFFISIYWGLFEKSPEESRIHPQNKSHCKCAVHPQEREWNEVWSALSVKPFQGYPHDEPKQFHCNIKQNTHEGSSILKKMNIFEKEWMNLNEQIVTLPGGLDWSERCRCTKKRK